MKKLLFFWISFFIYSQTNAQLLTWTPSFAKEGDNISITVDATKGNQGLQGFSGNVYVHTGVITSASTSSSDWKYSKFTWATTPAAALATASGTNKWTYNITGGIRAFYGVPAGETILKIAILFRDGAGNLVQRNSDGSDMYIPVYDNNLAVRFEQPPLQPKYTLVPEPINVTAGNTLAITGLASTSSNMRLLLNGSAIQTASNVTSISANPVLASGNQELVVEAVTTTPAATKRDTINFFVAGGVVVAPLPSGVREGINYNPNNTEVTLVLYAPNKNRVSIIGEFPGNNWTDNASYQMNKTPDGNYWWKTITGLTPSTIYAYQYLINGSLKVSDPYTEMILDPFNDAFITATTYPGLRTYPSGQQGVVSTLQTNAPTYTWNTATFTRPNKKGLLIYELHLRDFLAAHDFKTLKDSLNYLKNLGVNTIEIMPFSEFEGNNSWGYNPSHFFAADKYYGPKNKVKEFIDAAHANGIAVVMDMVMNHACGLSPQAIMYWNSAANQPAADNPWMNQTATHPFSVCYDFNHQSTATKYLVDRVVEHWLTEYKLDGFRWDLSKGFVQNTGGDWEFYNIERINTWKRIYDVMQAKSAGSYCILEHLGSDAEEQALTDYGMLTWGKMTNEYNQLTMGFISGSDIARVVHTARGFSQPHLTGYMESHDEERTMYKNLQFGNASGSYDAKNLQTALRRNEMAAALFLTIPGPKMWWQFAELGYDFSINRCENGTINNACRTDPKPIRWDYFQDINRRRLYDIFASLNNLRKLKPNAFTNGTIEYGVGGLFKWIKVTDPSLKICVISNMDVVQQSGTVTFQNAGTWYDYLAGGTITATGSSQSFTLAPGEYHVYIDQNINGAVFTSVNNTSNPIKNMRVLVYPNPVKEDALIEYDLPENGKVNITLLNEKGQNIGTIYSGYKTKGTQHTNFNSNIFSAKKLTAGMYVLQIEVNNKKRVEKIIIQ